MQSLHQFQTTFQKYLTSESIESGPVELYEPVNYILELGGKRLRPIVLLMSYSLFDENYKFALPAAMSIEVFHNFTLVHDDIMDDAPLRRGNPTVHEKYDTNTGILSGDVMLVLAYKHLLKMKDAPNFTEVLEVFTQTCVEVCEGQQMDMNFETRDDVSIPEYLKMIELKTSVLVAGAMKMGALLAGAPSDEADLIYEFGRDLGIAFQIQDDILDTFGDPEKFGKKVGGDIAQNKKTFLYLKAKEIADEALGAELVEIYNGNDLEEGLKINQVKEIFTKFNVQKIAEEEKNQYQKSAMDKLAELDEKGRDCTLLVGFAEMLMRREN